MSQFLKNLLRKKKETTPAKSSEADKQPEQPARPQRPYKIVAHAVDGREIVRIVHASSEHEAVFAIEKKTLHEGSCYYPHAGIVKYEVIE